LNEHIDRLNAALQGRYTIQRELGSGGMATVYLAQDIRHDREVAIKVLRPDLAAVLGPERFLQEIKIAAQLQHPNILPLHDSGEADGFLYYVMPYVEGQSLRDKLAKEGELPIGEAVRILRDIVDALTEAHAHGVVHRDIKPENVLLRGRHALVTDFGVAKAVSEATGRERLTTAGVALGTPAYMAPEQASADPHLDQRVDIYAMGAVAYELLTGRAVFLGTTPQMVLSAHMTEPPQPLTKYRQSIPAALEAIVLRCLEKRPADRWQSADELLPHLEALATPSGGVTPTDTRPVDARRRPSKLRSRVVRVGGAAAALIVVLGFGWMLRGIRSNGSSLDRIAVLPFQDISSSDVEFADAMHNAVITALARLDLATVVTRAAVMPYRDERKPDREIADELNIGGIVDAQVFRAGDRARLTVQFSEARTSRLFWAETYELEVEDVFAAQDSVAQLITAEIEMVLSGRASGQVH
jgi:serine/threonine protein kinase